MLPAPLKITFLTVMPSPYVQDLFAALAADDRIQLTVWYLEQVAPDTYWGEQQMPDYAQVLPGKWYGFLGARVHWNPGIADLIRNSDADLFVIVGYIGLTNQVAMRTLNRMGRPWVFWGEVPGFQQRGWLGAAIRSWLQKPLRTAAGIAAVGSHAVAAYRDLVGDQNPNCVYRNIPYHCRLDEFERQAQQRANKTADAAGSQADGRLRFLYCGQLIERKGVDLLCRAFIDLLNSGVDASLTLAGEGPLRDSLQAMVPAEHRQSVVFTGFQPVDKLPAIFGQADVFLLPSRHDGWGVVVNQALAAGMPVIATDAVGAARDLVLDQGTGWVVPAGDQTALLDVLQQAVNDRPGVSRMASRASEMAQTISLRQAVVDWYQFLSDAFAAAPSGGRHSDQRSR